MEELASGVIYKVRMKIYNEQENCQSDDPDYSVGHHRLMGFFFFQPGARLNALYQKSKFSRQVYCHDINFLS